MIRFVLSISILAAIITLIVLPMMRKVRKGIRKGTKKIEHVLTDELDEPKEEKNK